MYTSVKHVVEQKAQGSYNITNLQVRKTIEQCLIRSQEGHPDSSQNVQLYYAEYEAWRKLFVKGGGFPQYPGVQPIYDELNQAGDKTRYLDTSIKVSDEVIVRIRAKVEAKDKVITSQVETINALALALIYRSVSMETPATSEREAVLEVQAIAIQKAKLDLEKTTRDLSNVLAATNSKLADSDIEKSELETHSKTLFTSNNEPGNQVMALEEQRTACIEEVKEFEAEIEIRKLISSNEVDSADRDKQNVTSQGAASRKKMKEKIACLNTDNRALQSRVNDYKKQMGEGKDGKKHGLKVGVSDGILGQKEKRQKDWDGEAGS